MFGPIQASERTHEILTQELDNRIQRNFENNQQTLQKIFRECRTMDDFIIPIGSDTQLRFLDRNDKVAVTFPTIGEDQAFTLNEFALGQIAGRMKVPTRYVKDLVKTDWGLDLAQNILTTHVANSDDRRLLFRVVDNEVRGILSDKYKRIRTDYLYRVFMQKAQALGAIIYNVIWSETKTFIDCVIPRIFTIDTPNNGSVNVLFGVSIGHSDFGNGALDLKFYIVNVVCNNGTTSDSVVRKVHVGSRLPDNLVLSDRTVKLDTEANTSLVEDAMANLLNTNYFMRNVEAIRTSSSVIIDIDKEIKKLPKQGFTQEEIDLINGKFLNGGYHDGIVGEPTLWKYSQAITSAAHELEVTRKKEFDDFAGKLLKLPTL